MQQSVIQYPQVLSGVTSSALAEAMAEWSGPTPPGSGTHTEASSLRWRPGGIDDSIGAMHKVCHSRQDTCSSAGGDIGVTQRSRMSLETRMAWLEEDVTLLQRRLRDERGDSMSGTGGVTGSDPSSLRALVARLDGEMGCERKAREALEVRVAGCEGKVQGERRDREDQLQEFSAQLEVAMKDIISRIEESLAISASAMRERTEQTEARLRTLIQRVDEGLSAGAVALQDTLSVVPPSLLVSDAAPATSVPSTPCVQNLPQDVFSKDMFSNVSPEVFGKEMFSNVSPSQIPESTNCSIPTTPCNMTTFPPPQQPPHAQGLGSGPVPAAPPPFYSSGARSPSPSRRVRSPISRPHQEAVVRSMPTVQLVQSVDVSGQWGRTLQGNSVAVPVPVPVATSRGGQPIAVTTTQAPSGGPGAERQRDAATPDSYVLPFSRLQQEQIRLKERRTQMQVEIQAGGVASPQQPGQRSNNRTG